MPDNSSTSAPLPTVEDAAPRDTGVVKSAERVLRIFEFFDDVEREARLNEISERLGLPASSTSVLLWSLVRLGYLSHDPANRTFVPSLRIGMLGSWTTRDLAHHGWLTAVLDELSARTGETISLAARKASSLSTFGLVRRLTPSGSTFRQAHVVRLSGRPRASPC